MASESSPSRSHPLNDFLSETLRQCLMQMSDPTKEYSIRLRREAWDYLWQLVTQSEAGTTDWQAEAERYRKGMLNWKMTAEAKDAQIADLMRSETASMNAAPQTPDTATCGDVGASNAEADRRAGAEKGTALPVTGVRLDARERSATSEGSYGGARSAGAAPSDKHREAARLRKLLGEKKLREMDREERALVAHAAMKWAHSLQSADVCSACGAKEGEPCRGNCERRMPSHEQRTGKLMMTCPQCGWRAGVPEGWTPSATASHWISVRERMPKDCVEVLALFQITYDEPGRIAVAWYANSNWHTYNSRPSGSVTHWMPSPPAYPTESGNNRG
jgi:hypothetical protein